MTTGLLLGLLVGLALGAAIAYALFSARRARLVGEIAFLREKVALDATVRDETERKLAGTFAELSGKALEQNADQFLHLAEARLRAGQEAAKGDLALREAAIAKLLGPLQDTLARYEQGLRQLEQDRVGAYEGLSAQVRQIGVSHGELQRETRSLVTALRAPHTRGRWGEMQLRRVVEVAGMVEHCDFDEQVTTDTQDGRLRPDVVVHLPGGAQVVVDAKVPLDAFLRAAECEDENQRRIELSAHARQLRTHIDHLAKKQYWNQFDPSPEFVVAFIPGDPLLAGACESDPSIVEYAMASHVLLATPTTLIALLKTVAYTWQQEQMAESARDVKKLGAELYERLRVLGGHFGKMHRSLTSTVEAFNEAVGSLESRVLVTARRFPEMGVVGAGAEELPESKPVTAIPRSTQAPELFDELAAVRPDTHALKALPSLLSDEGEAGDLIRDGGGLG
jgi:DNA recombination protein RmuC